MSTSQRLRAAAAALCLPLALALPSAASAATAVVAPQTPPPIPAPWAAPWISDLNAASLTTNATFWGEEHWFSVARATGLARRVQQARAAAQGFLQAPLMPASTDLSPVSVLGLSSLMLRAAGLTHDVAPMRAALAHAGFAPRPGAGTLAMARLLGLWYNEPQQRDLYERSPFESASRAMGALMADQALRLQSWDVSGAERVITMLNALQPLPAGKQQAALRTAISLLGRPYVWGGTSDYPQTLFGQRVHSGYDCSGLVWRVMLLDSRTGPLTTEAKIGGRTTYDMARTTPLAQRIPYAKLKPGDLLLFGPGGLRAAWQDVYHVGIYLGGGLMINSSSYGVAIAPIDQGYARSALAFGKRVL